jgi:hypothetical protein
MAMPAAHTEWTAEMPAALPDGGQRYEIIDLPAFFAEALGDS